VQRNFNPDAANLLWSSDFTYIPTGEGWLYVAGVLDCFSRRLVAWSMAEHMRSEVVEDALNRGSHTRPDVRAGLV
jgi:putative transposase